MGTRQYIGARYVPKFYDYNGSSNWRAGTEYEALTIVTRNGNSYTSKIPVPSNIGEPESNPDYWVATGLYNTQVEEYSRLTLALSNRVSDVEVDLDSQGTRLTTAEGDIATLTSTVNSHGTRITDNESNIQALESTVDSQGTRISDTESDIARLEQQIGTMGSPEKPVNMKNVVFIGDSYGSRANNWITPLIQNLGLNSSEYKTSAVGSTGFAYPASGTNFITMLESVYNDSDETFRTNVTHIVVCAGANDSLASYTDVTSAIATFCTNAKNYFPNAKVYIGFIGRTTDATKLLDYSVACSAYKNAVASYVYLTNVEYTLKWYEYMENDGVHPTAAGCNALACNIWRALVSGSCSVQRTRHTTCTTVDANNTNVNFIESIDNSIYSIRMQSRLLHNMATPAPINGLVKLIDLSPRGISTWGADANLKTTVPVLLYGENLSFIERTTMQFSLINGALYADCRRPASSNPTIHSVSIEPFTMTGASILN